MTNFIRYVSFLLLLGLCILNQGCAQFINAFESSYDVAAMKGKPASMLVAEFGLPSFKYPDGSGGVIWVYQSSTSFAKPGSAYTTANCSMNSSGTAYYNEYSASYNGTAYGQGSALTTYVPSSEESYSKLRSFFINKDGIIYKTSFKMALK